jgi:predicted DNA-binding transcriptional regulator YafY
LLSIVFEVDIRPGVTAAELAVDLGVSLRTVYRDVTALQQAGVPLYGSVGRGGGLRLVEGYRSRSAALRSDEAVALLAGAVTGLAEQLGVADDAARARRKVRSQIGPSSPERSAGAQIIVDPIGWYRSGHEAPHLRLVAEAMRTQRVLDVVYRRWQDPHEVARQLEPHGLVLKSGTWYVMARTEGSIRTYRVDQIATATITATHFVLEPTFDLAATWAAFVATFHQRMRVIDVQVRMTRAARDRIRAEGDLSLCEALADALGNETDDDADRVVSLPFESVDRAVGDLLRLGTDVEVLSPASVRDQLVRTACAVAAQYPHERSQRPPLADCVGW